MALPEEAVPTCSEAARSPMSRPKASMMIDFPAPVSPVIAVNPGASSHCRSSTKARFLIRRRVKIEGKLSLKS